MWELDCEESWAPKNWCFWTVVLEKTLESPLDCKESQPVHPKGDQSWVFFGKSDAKAETPVLWPPHVKSWLIGKDPDAGRGWGQEEKGMTEDEIAGWTWVWVNSGSWCWTWVWIKSGSWWWTRRPGVLRFMGSQGVGHDWATVLNWTVLNMEQSGLDFIVFKAFAYRVFFWTYDDRFGFQMSHGYLNLARPEALCSVGHCHWWSDALIVSLCKNILIHLQPIMY